MVLNPPASVSVQADNVAPDDNTNYARMYDSFHVFSTHTSQLFSSVGIVSLHQQSPEHLS